MVVQHFQRGLRSRHISLIALGGIIGTSYFLGTGLIIHNIGPGSFIAYAVGGIITFLTMACLAELSVGMPVQGSFISHGSRLIGPAWGAGVGWSYWFSWVVYVASECLAGGILMHSHFPQLPVYLWAFIFGTCITIINLSHVKTFGEAEFWLAIVKIAFLVSFSLLAIAILFGWLGPPGKYPLGDIYLLKDGGLFPNGYVLLAINMVILMTNFQGSEVIGLTAAESHNPKKNIPKALEKVVMRVLLLYLVPTLLVAMIFPWQQANLQGSLFIAALKRYDLTTFAHIFSFFIIAGALSASNSGLYATVRSLYALVEVKMAPKFFKKLSRFHTPIHATWITLTSVWLVLFLSYFLTAHTFYANLLAVSGFSGAVCWISICWAHLRYRRLREKMQDKAPVYVMPGFPWLTHLGIWLQVSYLVVTVFSPSLRPSLYFGLPTVLLPMGIYWLTHRKKRETHIS